MITIITTIHVHFFRSAIPRASANSTSRPQQQTEVTRDNIVIKAESPESAAASSGPAAKAAAVSANESEMRFDLLLSTVEQDVGTKSIAEGY